MAADRGLDAGDRAGVYAADVRDVDAIAAAGRACIAAQGLPDVMCATLETSRGSGVDVVTLLPGYIATPMTRRNRHAMPFLLTADDFADRAFRAIEARAGWRVIPWQMGIVAKLLRLLPNAVFDRLAAGQPRKRWRVRVECGRALMKKAVDRSTTAFLP